MSPSRRSGPDVARKPVPMPDLHTDTSARLRDAPVSPVRVNTQPEHLIQPSNANIELAMPEFAEFDIADRTRQPPASESATPKPGNPVASHYVVSEGLSAEPQKMETTGMTPQQRIRAQEGHRRSGGSEETTGTSQQGVSAQSSAPTSASSVSGANDNDCSPNGGSPGSSVMEGDIPRAVSVPQFQYHHQPGSPSRMSSLPLADARNAANPEFLQDPGHIRRHLTPISQAIRRSSLPRPQSSYSSLSDSRGRSPGLMPGGSHMRAPSVQSRKSPDVRMSTYAELLNVPYPQQAPAAVTLDNSFLRSNVGSNASLLSTQKTLEMYRQNVKKTTDFSIQYSFAVFLISTAQEQGLDFSDPKGKKSPSSEPLRDLESPVVETKVTSPLELIREAKQILQRLAGGGYPFAQYYLADGYASGLFNKGKPDSNSAFPLFVLAAKHGHAESAYRAALSYEFGWGCRKDPAKAVQYLRSAAAKRHPGAMTRLGKACLSGDLGEKRYREGIKWMKLATESADTQYNAAPYQLGCLYETGYGDDVFKDTSYAAELFTQAADLGHPEANFRMGEAYEHGLLNCPKDPALSVHFYTGAAEKGHA
ncbi:hypothetical protein Golomagni_06425, partial [Golovinomyces magnicellulatus]